MLVNTYFFGEFGCGVIAGVVGEGGMTAAPGSEVDETLQGFIAVLPGSLIRTCS